jgi:putative CocE/NonD family hydrolase
MGLGAMAAVRACKGQALAIALLASTTAPSLAQSADANAFKTFQAPMRDGARLTGDLFLPERPGPFPLLLEVTPYGRTSADSTFRNEAAYWTGHGYAFAIAEVRGTGQSEGRFAFMDDQSADGADLINWLAAQPWSNGRIGMRGSSFSGANQWFAARNRPPALKCLNPNATIGQFFEHLPYRGGAYALGWSLGWIDGAVDRRDTSAWPNPDPASWLAHAPLGTLDQFVTGRELPLYRSFLAHETFDARWKGTELSDADFARIDLPTLAFSGWFDGTLPGTIWNFTKASTLSPARADQFLVVGPYVHANAADGGIDFATGRPTEQVGTYRIAENALLPGVMMARTFFDWCLKGGRRPDWPAARIYVTGTDEWLHLPAYPPATKPLQLLLSAPAPANGNAGNGVLAATDRDGRSHDSLRHDPAHPVMARLDSGADISLPADVRTLHDRPDVLVYTGKPLDAPLTVVGTVTLDLHISSSAPDTDFLFQLMDVHPDGRAIRLGPQPAAQIRARFRNGYDRPQPLKPGEAVPLQIQLRDIGHSFLPGHSIRIAVMSSLHPWIDVNRGTGKPIATDTSPARVATNRVWHDAARPSRLTLPVLDRGLSETGTAE